MAARVEWLQKEYYRVLGVTETATDKEITGAYRRLARRLHPDANPDGGTAERFSDVATAYQVLHDPAQRREYDRVRRMDPVPGAGHGRSGGAGPGDPTIRVRRPGDAGARGARPRDRRWQDLFDDAATGQSARWTGSPRRGQDLTAELTLTFEDAVRGTTGQLTVAEEQHCAVCGAAAGNRACCRRAAPAAPGPGCGAPPGRSPRGSPPESRTGRRSG